MVAVIGAPQTTLAVKVKATLWVPPHDATVATGCGALGDVTPPVAWSVATRLVVERPPRFLRPNMTVTVSFGSMRSLSGVQFSAPSVAPLATTLATAGDLGTIVNRASGLPERLSPHVR